MKQLVSTFKVMSFVFLFGVFGEICAMIESGSNLRHLGGQLMAAVLNKGVEEVGVAVYSLEHKGNTIEYVIAFPVALDSFNDADDMGRIAFEHGMCVIIYPKQSFRLITPVEESFKACYRVFSGWVGGCVIEPHYESLKSLLGPDCEKYKNLHFRFLVKGKRELDICTAVLGWGEK